MAGRQHPCRVQIEPISRPAMKSTYDVARSTCVCEANGSSVEPLFKGDGQWLVMKCIQIERRQHATTA